MYCRVCSEELMAKVLTYAASIDEFDATDSYEARPRQRKNTEAVRYKYIYFKCW